MPLLFAPKLRVKEIHYLGEPWTLDELEHIPLLHQRAKAIRDSLEVTNKTLSDIDFQNEQDFENFIDLLNNNMIFRLTYTHEYYLLANLFKDPKDKVRFIKFLDELHAHERDHNKQLQAANPLILRVNSKNIPVYAGLPEPMFLFTHPHPNLSHTERWQHYEGELQRITFDYHRHRIDIQNNSVQNDMQLINDALGVFRGHESDNLEVIGRLLAIKSDYEQKKQEIDRAPLYNASGAIDLEAIARKDKELELLQEGMASQISEIFDKNPTLDSLRAAHTEKKEKYAEQLSIIDDTFAEQQASLMIHIEHAKTFSKQEAVDNLVSIIDKLSSCRVDEIHRDERDESIRKLENYKNMFSQTDDYGTSQAILNECSKELVQLARMLPESSYKLLVTELKAFREMVCNHELISEAHVQPYPAAVDELHKEDEFLEVFQSNDLPLVPSAPEHSVIDNGQEQGSVASAVLVQKDDEVEIAPQADIDINERIAKFREFKLAAANNVQSKPIISSLSGVLSRIDEIIDDCEGELKICILATQATAKQIQQLALESQSVPVDLIKEFFAQLSTLISEHEIDGFDALKEELEVLLNIEEHYCSQSASL